MSEFQDKSERKSQLNDSCKTAEKFVDIFFAKIDSNRNTIGKMYLEQATLTWNGNPIKGEICYFIAFCDSYSDESVSFAII